MDSCEEIPFEEENTNIIPLSIKLSPKFKNNYKSPNKIQKIYKKNYNKNSNKFQFNNNINKIKLKRIESFSTTSMSSNYNCDKIKKVTFSTVEIIRIQNIKNFNKLNSYKADDIQNNNASKDDNNNCSIF